MEFIFTNNLEWFSVTCQCPVLESQNSRILLLDVVLPFAETMYIHGLSQSYLSAEHESN